MVGTNNYTNKNHKLYNLTVQAISRWGGDCAAKVESLFAYFVDMESLAKTHVGNWLSKIFNFQGQTIDVPGQAVFTLKYLVFHDE